MLSKIRKSSKEKESAVSKDLKLANAARFIERATVHAISGSFVCNVIQSITESIRLLYIHFKLKFRKIKFSL